MYVRAHLDVVLSVQSLDKTGEAVKEPICRSSLEGGRGGGRESCLAHIVCNLTLFNNQSVSTSPLLADTTALKRTTLGARVQCGMQTNIVLKSLTLSRRKRLLS